LVLNVRGDFLGQANGRRYVLGFADVWASASKGVLGSGDGALVVNGNLGITTPLFAGEASSKSRIEATGRLVTTGMPGSASVQSGLGVLLGFQKAPPVMLAPRGADPPVRSSLKPLRGM